MPIANTKLSGRQRLRAGRPIRYFPLPAEVALYGEGPYSGVITKANRNGTVSARLTVPGAGSNAATVLARSIAESKTNLKLTGYPGTGSLLHV